MDEKYNKLKELIFNFHKTYKKKREIALENSIYYKGYEDRELHLLEWGVLTGSLDILNNITDDLDDLVIKINKL